MAKITKVEGHDIDMVNFEGEVVGTRQVPTTYRLEVGYEVFSLATREEAEAVAARHGARLERDARRMDRSAARNIRETGRRFPAANDLFGQEGI